LHLSLRRQQAQQWQLQRQVLPSPQLQQQYQLVLLARHL
jgi:hypothetical protein